MKTFARNVLINFFTLFAISKLTGAVAFSDNIIILFWAAFVLTLFNLLVKPILNLLLMPINLLTLGASRWLIACIVLLLVTIAVSGFHISGFVFPGTSFAGFVIPSVKFSFFLALILVSFLIELLSGAIYWIMR